MEGMISEFRGVVEAVFLSGNWIFMGIVIASALIGVFAMRSFGQILCVSVLAMVALGLLLVVVGGAMSGAPTDPAAYLGQFQSGWTNLSATSGSTLVVYLAFFAVSIVVLFLGKSVLFRR